MRTGAFSNGLPLSPVTNTTNGSAKGVPTIVDWNPESFSSRTLLRDSLVAPTTRSKRTRALSTPPDSAAAAAARKLSAARTKFPSERRVRPSSSGTLTASSRSENKRTNRAFSASSSARPYSPRRYTDTPPRPVVSMYRSTTLNPDIKAEASSRIVSVTCA